MNEARVNLTVSGQNGDLRDPVDFNASDAEIKGWVVEAVASGSVAGIPAQTVDLTDFVVDRFPANEERGNLIALRPKTPFGC